MRALALRTENVLATTALAGIMLLPLAEIATRRFFETGIPGSAPFAQNLTLWVGMLGAAIAARDGKLLVLATGEFLPKHLAAFGHVVGAFVGAAVATIFAVGGWALVATEREVGDIIALERPGLGLDHGLSGGVRPDRRCGWSGARRRTGPAARSPRSASPPATGSTARQEILEGASLWPWLVALLVAGVLGAPIFALLGGIAMFGFFIDGSRPVVPLIKAYAELTSPSANIAAIPLFTLTGFLLAEGKSSERLLRALRGVVRLGAGGTAVAAATLCAFFTLFTGRVGRHDSRARRPAASGAAEGRLSGAILDRLADGVRLARPAVPALGAAHPLRHRRAERRRSKTCSSAVFCPAC